MSPRREPTHALLYDGECGFCRWGLGVVLAWDRAARIRPVALQDPEADRLLAGMAVERRMESWHLVSPDGTVRSAGAAAPELLRLLPRGRALAAVLASFPQATERVYRFVAGHRSWFAKPLGRRARAWAEGRIAARGGRL